MSDATDIQVVTIWQGTDLFAMGRLRGNDGALITQASLSSIAVNVFDETAGGTSTYAGVAVVADTVSDTLVTDDSRWDADHTGYNFGATVPAEAFPSGNHQYRVEVVFTPVSGGRFPLVLDVSTLALRSS